MNLAPLPNEKKQEYLDRVVPIIFKQSNPKIMAEVTARHLWNVFHHTVVAIPTSHPLPEPEIISVENKSQGVSNARSSKKG